jgi:DNA-nicking Smr family endonuclease
MGQKVSTVVSTVTDFWTAFTSPKPGEHGHEHREAARKQAELAQAATSQSQRAYARYDHHAARRYSDESKRHWTEYHRLNALAATEIFNSHNAKYPTDLSEIDLHGLFVSEALTRVEQHIQLCKKGGLRRTVLITGWGSHSKDGMAKIKPAMQELCLREGLKVLADRPNIGCMTVQLGVEPGDAGWDKCRIM